MTWELQNMGLTASFTKEILDNVMNESLLCRTMKARKPMPDVKILPPWTPYPSDANGVVTNPQLTLTRTKLITSPYLPGSWQQFRFPRSKKRRIRKKWAKRMSNYWHNPNPAIYVVGDRVFCNPDMLEQIIHEFRERELHRFAEAAFGGETWPIH